MELAPIVAVAAAIAVVVAAVRSRRSSGRDRDDRTDGSGRVARGARSARGGRRGGVRRGDAAAGPGTVVLEVSPADPGAPAVVRLATAIARDALLAEPGRDHVRVIDALGRELLRLDRAAILGPSAPGGPAGGYAGDDDVDAGPAEEEAGTPRRGPLVPLPGADRHLVDRFSLPPEIAAAVADVDDATELVRAILAAAGRETTVVDGVLRTGDEAVIVLGGAGALTHNDLSRGFLRYRSSGARRGLVILLGYVPPGEVARREKLAPDLHYVGAGAVQRMADAAALGADPIRFAHEMPTGTGA